MSCDNQEFECAICLECINKNNDYVKTECGHEFHCSCLMKNTAHNGYGCPYCRKVLAEETIDDDSENDEYDEENYDEYIDNIHLGFRMFMNNAYEEEHTNEDIILYNVFKRENEEETKEIEKNKEEEIIKQEETDNKITFMINLLKNKNTSMEDMLKYIMFDINKDPYNDGDEYMFQKSHSDKMYGLIQSAIHQYENK